MHLGAALLQHPLPIGPPVERNKAQGRFVPTFFWTTTCIFWTTYRSPLCGFCRPHNIGPGATIFAARCFQFVRFERRPSLPPVTVAEKHRTRRRVALTISGKMVAPYNGSHRNRAIEPRNDDKTPTSHPSNLASRTELVISFPDGEPASRAAVSYVGTHPRYGKCRGGWDR
jgi:hypothetical protein